MKRIGLIYREKIVKDVEEKYSQAFLRIFVGFNRLKASSLNALRSDLKGINALLLVSKNSLIKRALENLGISDFNGFLNGPTGLVFVFNKDITKVCKTLVEFSKDSEGALIVRGGYLEEKKVEEKDILELAKLPTREVLLGMAVSGLASPLTGFLVAMNQVVLKFLWLVEEIKKKKGGE